MEQREEEAIHLDESSPIDDIIVTNNESIELEITSNKEAEQKSLDDKCKGKDSVDNRNVRKELTLRSMLLMLIIGCVLSSANTYVGLFSGYPISASIPSAVLSLCILKFINLIRRNIGQDPILEVNLIQTGASAGSIVSASALLTIPALVQMNYWKTIHFWETSFIILLGSALGIFFSIPLRKILISQEKLKFPEGTATAVVLQTLCETGKKQDINMDNLETNLETNKNDSHEKNRAIAYMSSSFSILLIVIGAIAGACFKFFEIGLSLWDPVISFASYYGSSSALFFVSFICSPALLAIGYIIEINVGLVVFFGAATAFWISVPIVSLYLNVRNDLSEPINATNFIFEGYIRYMGVGAMAVGSLLSIIALQRSLLNGLTAYTTTIKSMVKDIRNKNFRAIIFVDRRDDIPIVLQIICTIAILLSICVLLIILIKSVWIGLLMVIFVSFAGFIFAAASGYMAGIVGSSNNPISGITLATVLVISLTMLLIMGKDSSGPVMAIFVGGLVACASAHSSDNMQDLKTGDLLGASSWKQQVAQLLGIILPSLLVAPVMTLLSNAYGIGLPTPSHPYPLPAPQARLMGDIANKIFSSDLPWGFVVMGMAIAALVASIDVGLSFWNSAFRVPVLAFSTGLYLPFNLSMPLITGGLISWIAKRHVNFYVNKKLQNMGEESNEREIWEQKKSIWSQVGLLIAAGVITGESIIGVLMAIPIVLSGDTRVFAVTKNPLNLWWLSLILLSIIFVVFYLFRIGYMVPIRSRS
jgi:putative OPT family oligopeptide transporter